jgi:hypothetical protein
MMPTSAPKGFFYYTPPDKTPIKVKTRDIAKHVGKLTKKSMVNRIKVDSTWVKAKTLPDFAPLFAASSTRTSAAPSTVVQKKKWKKGDFVYMTKAAGGKKIVVAEEKGDEIKIHYIGESSSNDEWLTANGAFTQLDETASVSEHGCGSAPPVFVRSSAYPSPLSRLCSPSPSPTQRPIQHQMQAPAQALVAARASARVRVRVRVAQITPVHLVRHHHPRYRRRTRKCGSRERRVSLTPYLKGSVLRLLCH